MGEFRESRGGEGHGHVRPRSDGSRTRCGGPGLCAVCNQEAARAWVEEHRERDALKAEVMLYRNKMGRIAIALFGEQNNVTDEACIAKAASVVEELADTNVLFQDAITLAQSNKDRLDVALAEVDLRKSEVELFRTELKARCDEVAKLRAACAAKDAALSKALGYVDLDNDALISKCLAALKGTAGRNYIDATGAVEAIADHGCIDGSGVLVAANVPDDWAGAPVKIVRVKP